MDDLQPCANECGDPIRLVRESDRVDPRDFQYVHDTTAGGNPMCAVENVATPVVGRWVPVADCNLIGEQTHMAAGIRYRPHAHWVPDE